MPLEMRRSARGAPPTTTTTTKPPPPASTASSSSLSSGRQDRNARLIDNQKSATPHSLSSEDISEPPRRSQRSHLPKETEASKDAADADEDAGEEEEITRCICGHQEYPGPPLNEASKEADAQSEDAGGLFISCDGCNVWQHGGCVGIFEESKVPDKYYCEECRPKLHELHTDANGQQYSLYQPVHGKSNRKASVSKHGDKAQRERDALRASAESQGGPGRRRGTMRSKEHDDEEEQLKRALEESKREVDGGTGKRGGKRVRDDSEDNKLQIKRQRTASESQPSNTRKHSEEDESDDEPTSTLRGKKTKSESNPSSRHADARDKVQEREKSRAEAAGRRQERAGRRRAEDELEDETPKPTASAKTSPPPSSRPESPPETNGTDKVPGKKAFGKKKKLGNNQYTNKARDASSPHGKKRSGASSGDENLANGDSHHDSASGTRKNSPDHAPSGKGKFKGRGRANGNGLKHEDPADLSVNQMKKRMDAMQAFLVRAQFELAPLPELGSASPAGMGGAVQPPAMTSNPAPALGSKALDEMNAYELSQVVTQSIAGWHQRFGHLG